MGDKREKHRSQRSREDVSAALIDAAATLYAESPASAVTVRRIAAEAGVNPAMVSRYFGGKDNLVRAVLERSQRRMAGRADEQDDLREGVLALFRSLLAENEFVAILARACLDGTLPDFPSGYPAMTGLVRRLEAETSEGGSGRYDPRVIVASLSSLALGWGLYGEFIRSGTGLDSRSREDVEDAVTEVMRRVVDLAYE